MDPPRLPEYPQYTADDWARGCAQARAALGQATWNGMNLRAKKLACAARIAIANGAAPRGPPAPRRPPPPPPRPAGPAGPPPGGEPAGGRRRRTRKTRKSRRHTRRSYF